MTREAIINKTVKTLHALPPDKVEEVADFADYISRKYEEQTLHKGIQNLIVQSDAFQFLKDEEDLYSIKDIIERY